jgi:uncharacterized protein (TIGR00297 family)
MWAILRRPLLRTYPGMQRCRVLRGLGDSVETRLRRMATAMALSGGIGLAARARGSLTNSGAVGALLTGTGIVTGGGWDWGAALVYFFVSSSALSHLAPARKSAIAADKFEKGSQRDLGQALANAGVATTLALLRATRWGDRHACSLTFAFAGALATANADTWATELGTVSRQPPRLITSGRPVPPGTSGGVTLLGLGATAAGAATLGAAFALARRAAWHATGSASGAAEDSCALMAAAVAGGIAGCLADSVLGATAQAMYRCPRCGVETERKRHTCGTPTIPTRGLPWLDNDGVNAASSLIGALAGAAASALATLRGPSA